NGGSPPLATICILDVYVMRGGYLYVFEFLWKLYFSIICFVIKYALHSKLDFTLMAFTFYRQPIIANK
ncbi:MAG: hypothetical protein ACMV14_02950, partial [Prevotella sp.]